MGREELISCFQDTLEKSNNGSLKQRTVRALNSNCVYKEGFVSKIKRQNESDSIKVYSGTTLDIAKRYRSQGKIAVLNFANPENPGGGVQFGAMAQEECLCRSSNLFPCINAPNVFDEYYAYHRSGQNYFYTDRLIYTKGVTVFKDDSFIPQLLPEDEWFEVDVITCAAPYIGKRKYTNREALHQLFKGRIKNIFEAAIDNHVDVLVLGAFGCGAFKNPPDIVAKAFKEVITENHYKDAFKQIVFAIKSTTNDAPWNACPNLVAFELEFIGISSELCKERMSGGTPVEYAYGDAVMPSGRIHKAGPDFLKYYDWKQSNPYLGKQFSVLGDSISTLEGYNPKGYNVFYAGDNCVRAGVTEAKDTWWGKVIDFFGGELLINNSWSGSRVTKLPEKEQIFPSGCSDERTGALHINNVMPDVILVYLGTNDWAFGAKTGKEIHLLGEDENEFFDKAYDTMLKKIKERYPKSEIWCCTLCETYISKEPTFQFPHKHGGTHIEEYNDIIRDVVWRNECKLIDLYYFKMAYDSIDGSHPNQVGMNTIATMVIRCMVRDNGEQFLDCEDGQHRYRDVGVYTGGCRSVCLCCGKEIHKSTLLAMGCSEKESESVMSAQNITEILYSDEVKMTIEHTSETLQFQNKKSSCLEIEQQPADKYVGQTIEGKYEVIKLIGRGGFCSTYVVNNVYLNKLWAMKVCDKTSQFYSPAIRETILTEAYMMKQLQHPAIPMIIDIVEDESNLFIIREYVEGETLGTIVQRNGAQPVDKVIEWSRQLCDVLSYLHSLNPPHIYRDMKPTNVVLKSDGMLKIIDFDTVRTYKQNKNGDTCWLGTRGYAAPEQFGGSQTDARTDIFGLGMTMYHLVTGINPTEPPYEIKPICSINSSLPEGLEYIISKCIQLNPKERYQSCDELMADLDNYHSLPRQKGILGKLFGKK